MPYLPAASVTPFPAVGDDHPLVWGSLAASTAPGATCTARARYANGDYSTAQGITATHVADSNGSVSWTYTRTSATTKGTGTHFVTCTLPGQTATANAPFTVS